MTLVELMVAMFVLALVSTAAYQMLLAQARGAQTTKSIAEVSDNARLGFNRMVRDVREADLISNVTWNPTVVPPVPNSFTIKVNYNGDATYSAGEILTYSFNPGAATVSLCLSNAAGVCSGTPEVFMEGVSVVSGYQAFDYASNNLDWDWDGNGATTWVEVDDAVAHGITGVGDDDGALDGPEFPYLTKIHFALEVSDGELANSFVTTAQLRNRV